MALDKDNPLKPVAEKVEGIRSSLMEFFRKFLMGFKPAIKSLEQFVKEVRNSAKTLMERVGKAAVKSFLALSEELMSIFPRIEKTTIEALKLAEKILAMIRKAADPAKIFKAVKSLVARLAKVFRTVVSMIARVVAVIDPISIVLKVIDTFKMVLRMILAWIVNVTAVTSTIKKMKSVVKKVHKSLQAQLKQVTQLVKESNALKPA